MGESLEITVAADGTVRAATHGIHGERCLDFFEILESLTEGRITESRYTADYAKNPLSEPTQSGVLNAED
jgi:hypothetical protein